MLSASDVVSLCLRWVEYFCVQVEEIVALTCRCRLRNRSRPTIERKISTRGRNSDVREAGGREGALLTSTSKI